MTCTDHWHRTYSLTCEQFAALLDFTAGRCNICGMREHYTPSGLYIDHDHAIALWAVRGLLCPRCNTCIEMPGMLVGPERDEYFAKPWHIRASLRPSEPAVRGVVDSARRMVKPRRFQGVSASHEMIMGLY